MAAGFYPYTDYTNYTDYTPYTRYTINPGKSRENEYAILPSAYYSQLLGILDFL